MKLSTIDTGFFKLDGGAMFGVVPKSIWKNLNPPDENNLCTWAMRCLLIEEGNRLVLVDCGMGNKQNEKFFSYYQPHGEETLEKSLLHQGFNSDDITDVFLTHLHFDHCGGAVSKSWDEKLLPTFKNATYWSCQSHWDWAINPNDREKASFLKENILPLQESGQLKFLNEGDQLFDGFSFITVNGHTESMMLPKIKYQNKTIVYMADLMPSVAHLPVAYVMAYDVRPLITLKEKKDFLNEAADNNYHLFFEHDRLNECCSLKRTERGVREDQIFKLDEL